MNKKRFYMMHYLMTRPSTLEIPKEGCCVHLKGYGQVKVFKVVDGADKMSFWATSDTELTLAVFLRYAQQAWDIETYHRGIKQCTGIEKCQARKAQSQRNHILFALRAFLRLEYQQGKRIKILLAQGLINMHFNL